MPLTNSGGRRTKVLGIMMLPTERVGIYAKTKPRAKKVNPARRTPAANSPGSATTTRKPSQTTRSGPNDTVAAKKAPTNVLPSSNAANDIGAASSRS